MSGFRALGLVALCVLLLSSGLPALAAGPVGIVLLHGKTGMPGAMSNLAAALTSEGYMVSTPEMCWSKKRIFDKSLSDCLLEVDAAVAQLKAKGAARIVVAGTSQGAMAAFDYGAIRDGLSGIIAMAPAADPVNPAKYPGFAEGLDKAKSLIAGGQGDAPAEIPDLISGGKTVPVKTTANIYMSFHAPDSPVATMPNLTADLMPRQKAPVLWIAGSRDPSQAQGPAAFAALPANPLNRYATVDADHGGTPDASAEAIIAWLKTLP